jgi:hypothetical protein
MLLGALLGSLIMSAPALPAHAASVTWSFTGSGSCKANGKCDDTSESAGNIRTATASGKSVKVMGFAATASGNTQLETAWLAQYLGGSGGLAIQYKDGAGDGGNENTGSPQHGTDNDGRLEFLVFVFDTPVDPKTALLNYYGSTSGTADRDLSVWVGNGDANPFLGGNQGDAYANVATLQSSLVGKTVAQLDAAFGAHQNDFTFAGTSGVGSGNYGGTGTATLPSSPGTKLGNVLIIAPAVNGNTDAKDHFKFEALTADYPTPAPMSMLLIGVGLVGAAAVKVRRRRR